MVATGEQGQDERDEERREAGGNTLRFALSVFRKVNYRDFAGCVTGGPRVKSAPAGEGFGNRPCPTRGKTPAASRPTPARMRSAAESAEHSLPAVSSLLRLRPPTPRRSFVVAWQSKYQLTPPTMLTRSGRTLAKSSSPAAAGICVAGDHIPSPTTPCLRLSRSYHDRPKARTSWNPGRPRDTGRIGLAGDVPPWRCSNPSP
ncbi:hypothetical protein PX52LOC_04444 [Limnoglobus roseus]|uniref:Uncharacterized protein n=1 Tax=Limnoglobus roseus TaxID=2598579 RepID=A0A5C1AFT5_9BACT|nr:hypothetical protein PX52LOC_04444 [Limnoglobus roseus]